MTQPFLGFSIIISVSEQIEMNVFLYFTVANLNVDGASTTQTKELVSNLQLALISLYKDFGSSDKGY